MGDYRFARGFGAIVCAVGDGGLVWDQVMAVMPRKSGQQRIVL